MVFTKLYDWSKPLHEARCWSEELEEGQTEGTYTIINSADADQLSDSTAIIVMDQGKVLFWNAAERVAYEFGGVT